MNKSILLFLTVFLFTPALSNGETVHIESGGTEVNIKTKSTSNGNGSSASSSVKSSVSSSNGESHVKIDTITESNGTIEEYHFEETGTSIEESYTNTKDDGNARVETSVDVNTSPNPSNSSDDSSDRPTKSSDSTKKESESFHLQALSYLKGAITHLVSSVKHLFS